MPDSVASFAKELCKMMQASSARLELRKVWIHDHKHVICARTTDGSTIRLAITIDNIVRHPRFVRKTLRSSQ